MAENRKLGNNRLDTTDKGQAYFDGPFGINKGELPVVDLGWEGKALTVNEDGVTSLTTTVKNALTASTLEGGPIRIDPGEDPNPTGTLYPSSTFLFQSSSNTLLGYDLYFRQNGNIVKWKWFEGLLESGLLYGGVVTFSGSYVYVSSGSGILVDHNAVTGSEIGPLVDYVTWGPITQSITNIATQQLTYIYIDDTGALQQQSTAFTSQQYHSSIPLGAVAHFNYNSIGSFGGSVQTSYDQVSQILTFVDAFGPLKISGYGITGQASSLQISVGSGVSFIHGGFYDNDPQFPSEIPTTSQLTASIVYVHRSGSGVKFDNNNNNYFTSLRPGFYDPGTGTTSSVANNNWTIQRVFSEPKTGIVYVYYGQNVYTTYNEAVANVSSDSFTEGDTFGFTTFLGFLVLKNNTTDITDTSDNKIITAGLFRGGAGGAGGGSAVSSLDDLSDVSISSPTNGQALVYNSSTSLWGNGVPVTSSYALTASFLPVGTYQITSSQAINAQTASFLPVGTYNITSSWAQSASNALRSISASRADTASFLPVGTYQITSSWAVSASQALTASFLPVGTYNITSSWAQSASNAINAQTASFLPVGTYQITSSWAINALTASFIAPTGTNAFVQGGNSFGTTATLGTNDANSLVLETSNTTRLFISSSGNIGIGTATPANALEVNGGITATSLTASGAIINGNVTITGTASIAFLNVTYESASVIYSTGSNQFGDASDDTQTLYGSVVIPTGSLTVTGSTNITGSLNVTSGITGSLLGTSSWAINALTASNIFPAITNNTDNRVLTATGGGIINGESNLTFDGSVLTVSGNILTTGAITSSGAISSSAGLFSTTLLTGNITASNISASSGVTGSLFGTSSWAVSASNSINAQTASNIFPAIANNTSTYVLTATGDGTINGNSNLTFDGNDLTLGNGDIKLPVNGYIFGGDTEILNGNHVLFPANPPALPNDVLVGTSSLFARNTQIQIRSISEPDVVGGYESGSIFFKTPSGSGMTYTNEGRLGIGVSNPTNTLQIQGNVSASSYTGSLFGTSSWAVSASQALTASFIAPTGNAFVQGGNSFGTTALLGTNDSQSLQFETSGSVRVTISSSGNVGIGTTTPTTTLNVSGTTLLQGGQTTVRGSGATSATTALRVENSSAAARLTILDDGTSAFNTSHLYISSSGNVGIGITTPTARLQIAGTSNDGISLDANHTLFQGVNARLPGRIVVGASSGAYPKIMYNAVPSSSVSWSYAASDTAWAINMGGGNRMSFEYVAAGTAGTSFNSWNTIMVLVSGSNSVGIGTTSPAALLDVNGNTIIRGALTASNISASSNISSSTLRTTSNTAVGGTLSVTGATTLTGALTASNISASNNISGSTLHITGNENIGGTSTITGRLTANSGITTTTITASGAISSSAGLLGTTVTATSNVTVGGTLSVTGATTLTGALTASIISASSWISGSDLRVAAATTIGGTLGVTGATTLTGALTASNISASNNISGSTLHIVGSGSILGNVGIGTITPQGPLHIRGTSVAGITPAVFLDTNGTDSNEPVDIRLASGSARGIRIIASSSLSNIPGGASIQFYSNNSANFGGQFYIDSGTTSSSALIFRTANTAASVTERMRIAGNGTVSITGAGTTAATTVLNITDSNPTTRFTILGDGTSAFNTNHLYISGSGNVGVGITTPSALFHVSGTTRTEGVATFTNNLTSPTFISGWAGSGWRLDYASNQTSSLDLDNLTVRGQLRVFELVINQIRATNGSLFVSSVGKVVSASFISGTDYFLTFDTASGDVGHGFARGDIIRAQRVNRAALTGSGVSQSIAGNLVYQSDLTVRNVTNLNSLTASLISGTAPSGGMDFVRLGNSESLNRQGTIYLTADDSYAPFIDVVDGVKSHSEWNNASGSGGVKVRMGKLNGITSPTFGPLTASGNNSLYGFWASGSAYLEGGINATFGNIAGWTINTLAITKSGLELNSSGTFFRAGTIVSNLTSGTGVLLSGSGDAVIGNPTGHRISFIGSNLTISASNAILKGDTVEISGSNFHLINGSITASNALLSGTITANTGAIGGWNITSTAITRSNVELNSSNNFIRLGAVTNLLTGSGIYLTGSGEALIGSASGHRISFIGGNLTISASNAVLKGNTVEISGSNFHLLNGSISASNATLSGTITANAGRIGGFAITQDAITGSGFFLSGSATGDGFFISASNFNVKANGQVTGSNVLFTGGKVGGFTLSSDAISGTGFFLSGSAGTNDFFISSSNFNVKGSGTITASAGLVGGWNITSTAITRSGAELNSSNNFIRLGTAIDLLTGSGVFLSGSGEALIGSASGHRISFISNTLTISASNATLKGNTVEISSSNFHLTGGNVTMTGTITANAGRIGGFGITQDAITGSGFFLSGSATGDGFFISASNFNVKANGQVTGSNVLFTGGKVGGFNLSSDAISGTGFFLSGSATGDGFFISASNFNVKANGQVTGSNVLFTGGKIGGFTLSSDAISGTGFLLSGSATGDGFFISASNFNVKANGTITASAGLIGGFNTTSDKIESTGSFTSGSFTSPYISLKANGQITGSEVLLRRLQSDGNVYTHFDTSTGIIDARNVARQIISDEHQYMSIVTYWSASNSFPGAGCTLYKSRFGGSPYTNMLAIGFTGNGAAGIQTSGWGVTFNPGGVAAQQYAQHQGINAGTSFSGATTIAKPILIATGSDQGWQTLSQYPAQLLQGENCFLISFRMLGWSVGSVSGSSNTAYSPPGTRFHRVRLLIQSASAGAGAGSSGTGDFFFKYWSNGEVLAESPGAGSPSIISGSNSFWQVTGSSTYLSRTVTSYYTGSATDTVPGYKSGVLTIPENYQGKYVLVSLQIQHFTDTVGTRIPYWMGLSTVVSNLTINTTRQFTARSQQGSITQVTPSTPANINIS